MSNFLLGALVVLVAIVAWQLRLTRLQALNRGETRLELELLLEQEVRRAVHRGVADDVVVAAGEQEHGDDGQSGDERESSSWVDQLPPNPCPPLHGRQSGRRGGRA